MAESILDFSKITERDTIKLPGGAVREMINRTDLGIYEYHQLEAMQGEAAKLSTAVGKNGQLPPAKAKQLMQLLGQMVKVLVPSITPTELSKLERANREQIILAWVARQFAAEEVAAAGNAVSRRTGGASSRVSRRSTAATRKRGSTRRSG